VITIFSDLGISDLGARVASGGLDHMAGQVQGPGASLAPLARAWARGGGLCAAPPGDEHMCNINILSLYIYKDNLL
jgi:hypothetical protein